MTHCWYLPSIGYPGSFFVSSRNLTGSNSRASQQMGGNCNFLDGLLMWGLLDHEKKWEVNEMIVYSSRTRPLRQTAMRKWPKLLLHLYFYDMKYR